jgi:hypothetical protein
MNEKTVARLRINRTYGEISNLFLLMAKEKREITIWPTGDFCKGSISAFIEEVDLAKREYKIQVLSDKNFSDFGDEQSFYIQEEKGNILFNVIINKLEKNTGVFQIPHEVREAEKRQYDRYKAANVEELTFKLCEDLIVSAHLFDISQGGMSILISEENYLQVQKSLSLELKEINGNKLENTLKLETVHCYCQTTHSLAKKNIRLGLKFENLLDVNELKTQFLINK